MDVRKRYISFIFSRSDGSEDNRHTNCIRFSSLPSLCENRDDLYNIQTSFDGKIGSLILVLILSRDTEGGGGGGGVIFNSKDC